MLGIVSIDVVKDFGFEDKDLGLEDRDLWSEDKDLKSENKHKDFPRGQQHWVTVKNVLLTDIYQYRYHN